MVDLPELEDLLRRPESRYLDFKGAQYDLKSERGVNGKGYLDMVKDILCMANTPRPTNAYVVTGVTCELGKENRVKGIKVHYDDNDIQKILKAWLKPIPNVIYSEQLVGDKYVGVYEIQCAPLTGPFHVNNGLSRDKVQLIENREFLKQDQLYFRRGTTNAEVQEVEKAHIIDWFNSQRNDRWQEWELLLAACDDFADDRHYVLITSKISRLQDQALEPLSYIKWSAVIDFDPHSDEEGLMHAFRSAGFERNIIPAVMGERTAFNSRHDTYWFFARGLSGRRETIDKSKSNEWVNWIRQYGSEIHQQFHHIAKTLLPASVTLVVIWDDDSLNKHLSTLIEATSVISNAKYVIISESNIDRLDRIEEDFPLQHFGIPLSHLIAGLSVDLSSHNDVERLGVEFPGEFGNKMPVPRERVPWLESQLRLVHLGTGKNSSEHVPAEQIPEFHRGGIITWQDLNLGRDLERDITRKIARRVRGDLETRTTEIVRIFHKPGAGGTTISRRILWNLHHEFPCVVIHSGEPVGAVERIEYVANNSRLAVLALLDSAEIADHEIENIYDRLRARNTGCVLLSVSRRHQLSPSPGRRSFSLDSKLSISELQRFNEKYASLVPNRRQELESIVSTNIVEEQTAFQFGLTAFEENYKGLKPYVSNRLKELTDVQRQIVVFLSIASVYAQRSLSAQSFQYLLGLSNRDVVLHNVFENQQSIFDILIKERDSKNWRPIHDIVSREVLIHVLGIGEDAERNWKQQLSPWGKRFIEFCGDGWLTANETTLTLLRRVFIIGEDSDRVVSGLKTFPRFIQDIPVREGRLEILRLLAEEFPYEAHFWAHLGRYQALIMRNFPASLEAIDRALKLEEEDPVLWHMKGMSYRYQAQSLMEARKELQEVIDHAQKASECFEKSRIINPDNEHAYISEIQLLARVLNYAARDTDESIFDFMQRNTISPYVREAFDNAESLLAIVRSNREGMGSSTWEAKCRADISNLYGDHKEALQVWDSLLTRHDLYRPPVRRQIVYALKNRDKGWNAMPKRSLERCIELLQENLDENPSNDRDLRQWLQAVRYSALAPSVESLIEKVSYWRAGTGALDARYYLYVLYSLQTLDGLSIELGRTETYLRDCQEFSRNRRNRLISFEWLGKSEGIKKLVHQSALGEWNRELNFWSNSSSLKREEGVISHVRGPERGTIQLRGLSCFFVPGAKRKEPISTDSVNRRVNFFLGFSYSGIRAWDVEFS